VGSFGHVALCDQLTDADVEAACASREDFEALLVRCAEVSAPKTGAPKVLVLLARLASTTCEWVDGDVSIDLCDVDDATEVRVMSDLGGGMRELLIAPVTLKAPLAEMTSALEDKPTIVGGLKVSRRSWKRLNLHATDQVRRSSRPPRVSEASLVAVRPPESGKKPRF
jgi:hypothetical protein